MSLQLTGRTLPDLWTLHGEKMAAVQAVYDSLPENDAPTDEQFKAAVDLNKEIEEIEHAIADANERKTAWQAQRADTASRAANASRPVYTVPFAGDANDPRPATNSTKAQNSPADLWTPGQAVLENADFKSWIERIRVGDAVTNANFGHSPAVKVPTLVKALITGTSDTSAGAMVRTSYFGDVGLPFRMLTVMDIITVLQTTSDIIEYARVSSFTNAAAPVAEASATSGGTGAKPESTLVFEKITTAVKTIAHWIPATRRALADASQLRGYIDSFLRYGLEEELEDQIINGDGVGENFTGITNMTGTTAQAWDTNILTTTRKGRTLVRTTGRATPTAYLLHPNDWQTLDLLQDNEARYFFGGPAIIGNPRLWGLPVVESEGATEGVGFVGDFRQVVLWNREQTQILVSDSHSDFFIRNLVAILAEMRAALGVLRPAAIVELDLTA